MLEGYGNIFLFLACCLAGVGMVLGTLRFLHKQTRTHVMTIERPEGEQGEEAEEDEDE